MERLNKDSHHTRRSELIEALTEAFRQEKPGETVILDQFCHSAFRYPHGHPRVARGSSVRSALTNVPVTLSPEAAQAIAHMLTTKNMYAILNEILLSPEKRMTLVQTFETIIIPSLSPEQLSQVSPILVRDLYRSLKTPEERAQAMVVALGKTASLDGVLGMQWVEKNIHDAN